MDKATDYVRVKGTARRFRHKETGKEISRWAMQTLQAGGINPAERAEIRSKQGISSPARAKQKRFNKLVSAFKKSTAKKLGVSPSKVRVRGDTQQAKDFRQAAKKLSQLTDRQLENKDADGALAQLLVDLNLRNPEWDMPVGESPS